MGHLSWDIVVLGGRVSEC